MQESSSVRSQANGIPVSPGLDAVAAAANVPQQTSIIDRHALRICGYALVLGVIAAFVGQLLVALIELITNIAFFGRLSTSEAIPAIAAGHLGWWIVPIPVVGGLIVGFIAKYGSTAIRGHGLPEAIEQVLTNESRIQARVTILKPLSSAISIGTGGPFGAEGPIIATGSALGSVFGQMVQTTSSERKTLLAAGAAAGVAAVFGTPMAAVLLAIELLLFEFRPRSMIPVALAATVAEGVRMAFHGSAPAFAIETIAQPSGPALATYVVLGGVVGTIAVGVTRVVHLVERWFEKIPIHWMWWPALGGVAVGVIGFFVPDTLGVGYYNITNVLTGKLTVSTVTVLVLAKFISWSIALGSGTSGGTLAPLLFLGSGVGMVIGSGVDRFAPALEVNVHVAALVGMAAMFAGASRALLASVVFAFETTLQPMGLLPLLGGCATAYVASSLLMRNTMMTEKVARRGVRAPEEFLADALDQVLVSSVASRKVTTIRASQTVAEARAWFQSDDPESNHQGYPVVSDRGFLTGVITRKNILDASIPEDKTIADLLTRPPKYVYDDCTVRQAADHMVNHGIGRLPVVRRSKPTDLIGIITRSDVLSVFQRRLKDAERQQPTIRVRFPVWRGRQIAAVPVKPAAAKPAETRLESATPQEKN